MQTVCLPQHLKDAESTLKPVSKVSCLDRIFTSSSGTKKSDQFTLRLELGGGTCEAHASPTAYMFERGGFQVVVVAREAGSTFL
jgi:hypothetical protein